MTETSLRSPLRNSSPGAAHHPVAATFATLAAAAFLAPFAGWQFGAIGAAMVTVFAVAVVLAEWLAALSVQRYARTNRTAASLLTASGIRMVLPLAVVLMVVVRMREHLPVESVLYVVPLYLVMLLADVALGWRSAAAEGEE